MATSCRYSFHGVVAALALFMVAFLASCNALPGQGPSARDVNRQAEQPSTEPGGFPRYIVIDLNPRSLEIVRSRGKISLQGTFGDRGGVPYQTIGVGDSLVVTIWEAGGGGLFSAPVNDRSSPGSNTAVIPEQVVAQDGSITVPYAGRIRVVGMTPPQVEAKIVKELAGKAIDPQAVVSIAKNIANSVTITGDAIAGTRVALSPRGDRILDVIATAGAMNAPVHETFVALNRKGRSISVPMQVLMSDPRENIYIHPGDTITLTRNPQSFTVFGAAGRNAMVNFEAQGITLEMALAKAGGLLDFQSDPAGVFLLRSETGSFVRKIAPDAPIRDDNDSVNVVYRVNLRDTNTFFLAKDFEIRNKDIIYIATADANSFQKFFSLMQISTTSVFMARAVTQ